MLACTLTYVLTIVKPCVDMGVLDNGETQMTKPLKIRVRKTPYGLHLYVATVKGVGTYGWGDTPTKARACLLRNLQK